MPMSLYDATMIVEGVDTGDEDEAFRVLISTGAAWTLQGSFGRAARDWLINNPSEFVNDPHAMAIRARFRP